MEILETNVEPLPLTGDGGLGDGVDDGARTAVKGGQIAQRLGIPDETVRRHVRALSEAGYAVRTAQGHIVPGALLASPAFDRLFSDNHRNLVRLFGQLAAYDALRPIEEAAPSARLQAG